MNLDIWYAARSAGVVALLLLTGTTALGVATRSGRPVARLPRFAVQAVHRNLSLLAVVFLGVHIGTLLADPDAELRLVNIVVPFTSAESPLSTGLGAAALDVLVALVVTSMLRRWIGRRVWRTVHWAAYGLWPIAAAHGITDGTDAGRIWFLALWAACVLAVLVAVVWRLVPGFQERSRARITSTQPVYPGGAPTTANPRPVLTGQASR